MIDNLTLYRFFLDVAKSGSISGAARHLYVTQPAVSSGIMQLEQVLGVKLFFRTSRGMNLTPEGELLYEYVSSALTLIEAGEDKLRDIGNLNSGVMRIGASDMTLKYYLLDYIQRFNVEYPKVKLTVTNNPTPQTLKALKNGIIDFCVISDSVERDDDINFIAVKQINDIVVCSDRYSELYNYTTTFDMLFEYPLIMLERGTSTRSYIDQYAPQLEPAIELAQSELVLEFARRGIGIAFIVEDFAKADLESGHLHMVKLAEPFPPRNFLLAYLKKIPLSAASKKFIDTLNL